MNEKQQGTPLKTDYKTRRGWFLRGAVTPLRTKSLKTATNCIFNLFSILVYNCLLQSTFNTKHNLENEIMCKKKYSNVTLAPLCRRCGQPQPLHIMQSASNRLPFGYASPAIVPSLGLLVWSTMQWPMQLGGGRGRSMDAEIVAPPVMETKSHLFCTDYFDQQDSNGPAGAYIVTA